MVLARVSGRRIEANQGKLTRLQDLQNARKQTIRWAAKLTASTPHTEEQRLTVALQSCALERQQVDGAKEKELEALLKEDKKRLKSRTK